MRSEREQSPGELWPAEGSLEWAVVCGCTHPLTSADLGGGQDVPGQKGWAPGIIKIVAHLSLEAMT